MHLLTATIIWQNTEFDVDLFRVNDFNNISTILHIDQSVPGVTNARTHP